jgi:chromosome partitioning protein
MPTIVSFINLKGGVAKTTTAIQIAECLSAVAKKRVLVIDLDPQTNATVALISEEHWENLNAKKQTIFNLFNDQLERTSCFKINQAIQKGVSNLNIPSLSLLASSIDLLNIQDRIYEIPARCNYKINPMEVLKKAIHHELFSYDYVFIDCPPNLGLITKNGLEISDYYLIPTIPDKLSTYGLPQIIRTIKEFADDRSSNIKIRCLGLVITKYVSNSNAHIREMERLPARFEKIFRELQLPPAPVFDTVMPQANATAEAMDFETNPSTFRQKYGSGKVGGRYLYEYVVDLTNEFIRHVRN